MNVVRVNVVGMSECVFVDRQTGAGAGGSAAVSSSDEWGWVGKCGEDGEDGENGVDGYMTLQMSRTDTLSLRVKHDSRIFSELLDRVSFNTPQHDTSWNTGNTETSVDIKIGTHV